MTTTTTIELSATTASTLARVAADEGVSPSALAERWIVERADDDLRRRMRAAVAAPTRDDVIFSRACAVTALDLEIQVTADLRGLWVWLRDESPQRERAAALWAKADPAIAAAGRLREGALLEWPSVRALRSAIDLALRRRARD